jgi:hypothetical protein
MLMRLTVLCGWTLGLCALSWLKQLRRLRIRWDRLEEIHQAFLDLACSLIVWRYLIA